jgi:glycine cleavage system H protein
LWCRRLSINESVDEAEYNPTGPEDGPPNKERKMYPTDRRYTKDHEWILVEGNQGTIGLTDYAQDQLGDIVYLEMPEEGAEFSKGDVMGSVESVKAVSEIYAPIGVSVKEVNSALADEPEKVNAEPHGGGWICKVEISDLSELEELMDAAGYEEYVASES